MLQLSPNRKTHKDARPRKQDSLRLKFTKNKDISSSDIPKTQIIFVIRSGQEEGARGPHKKKAHGRKHAHKSVGKSDIKG